MPATLVLLLALGQFAGPQLGKPGASDQLRADSVEVQDGDVHAEGNVRLRSGGILLRAEAIDYDSETREGEATGEIVLIDGAVVLRARAGVFSLADRTLALDDVVLAQKAAPVDVERYADASFGTLRGLGKNTMVLRAREVERLANAHFVAKRARMTPCDCADGKPDWEISTSSADIEPGERAILTLPIFYVSGIPVFALPALYLPLSSRRTGLLFPQFGHNTNSGSYLDEPLFITLGESYDATLTAGYFFGTSGSAGIKGPRLLGEFRYAPSTATSGRLQLQNYIDQNSDHPGATGARGWRGALLWRHGTEAENGRVEFQTDVDLVSDTHVPRDTQPWVPVPYTRSEARAALRGDEAVFEVAGAWYQPLNVYTTSANGTAEQSPSRYILMRWRGEIAPVQRPLAVTWNMPSRDLGGGLRGGLGLTAALVQPVGSQEFVPADRASAGLARIDLLPRLSRTLTTGVVDSEVYAGAQADVTHYSYSALVGPIAPPDETSGWARTFVGAQASTLLVRTLGDDAKAMRNTLEPRLEVRALSRPWNKPMAIAGRPRDEFDVGNWGGAQVQAVASVSSRLLAASGGEVGRLVIGQDAELRSGTPGDTFATLDARLGYLSAYTGARFDPRNVALPLFTAGVGVDNGAGTSLGSDYVLSQSAAGTDRTRAGMIDLFQVDQYFRRAVYDQLNLRAAWRPFTWISLSYNSSLNPTGSEVGLRKFLVHRAGVTLTSACDCWAVTAIATAARPSWEVDYRLLLDLKELGSFGSAR